MQRRSHVHKGSLGAGTMVRTAHQVRKPVDLSLNGCCWSLHLERYYCQYWVLVTYPENKQRCLDHVKELRQRQTALWKPQTGAMPRLATCLATLIAMARVGPLKAEEGILASSAETASGLPNGFGNRGDALSSEKINFL